MSGTGIANVKSSQESYGRGMAFEIDPKVLDKNNMIITSNTGAPIVTSREELMKIIPNRGPLARPCGNCNKRPNQGTKFPECSQCGTTHYCRDAAPFVLFVSEMLNSYGISSSRECQRAHWKTHRPMCLERKARRAQIKQAEAEAVQEGRVYHSPLTTQAWYRKHSHVVSNVQRRIQVSPEVAFFSLIFDKDKPNDVNAISLRDIHALPASIMAKLAGPGALAHVQRSMTFGYMVVVMGNEDFSAMAMEMHYPDSPEPYTTGKKKPDENWRLYSILAASGLYDKLE